MPWNRPFVVRWIDPKTGRPRRRAFAYEDRAADFCSRLDYHYQGTALAAVHYEPVVGKVAVVGSARPKRPGGACD